MNRREKAISLINTERERQLQIHEFDLVGTSAHDSNPYVESYKYVILGEEVGEIARAMQDGDKENLIEELSQVGALSVAWLESLLEDDAV